MATNSKKKVGRPKNAEKECSLRLRESTIHQWNELKSSCQHKTHNDFALHLLGLLRTKMLEQNTSRNDSIADLTRTPISAKAGNRFTKDDSILTKTDNNLVASNNISGVCLPLLPDNAIILPASDEAQDSATIIHETITNNDNEETLTAGEETQTASEMDDSLHSPSKSTYIETGLNNTSLDSKKSISILESRCLTLNHNFSMLKSKLPDSSSDESESESESESDNDRSSSSSDENEAYSDDNEEIEHGLNQDQVEVITEILNGVNLNDDSFEVDFDVNRTFTLDANEYDTSMMDIESETSQLNPTIDATFDGNLDEIKGRLEKGFDNIFSNKNHFSAVDNERFIISVDKLKELKGAICHEKTNTCDEVLEFTSHTKGSVITLAWSCKNNHFGKWISDNILSVKKASNVYVSDVLISAALMFSGNNYIKLKMFADFLNINMVSASTFHRIQKLYCTPSINEYWLNMKDVINDVYKDYSNICLCGDGRNDSPGHSAKVESKLKSAISQP